MTDEHQIGDRLKELRSKLGVKQDAVASEIGISRARYSHYENNHVEPDIELINKLANYYNVSSDYLLGRSNTKYINGDMEETEIDPELQQFIDEVKVWYKDEPESKEEKLKMFKRMFEAFKED